VGITLPLLAGAACVLHRTPGRPGIDYETPPTPPPFSAPVPLDETAPASGKDAPARLLKQTAPVYPRWAFAHKIEGTVMMDLLVDENGKVVWWDILKSIPPLDAAAVRCVRQWVFSPALSRGRRVPGIVTTPVSFKIKP
jgi:TonB family protein